MAFHPEQAISLDRALRAACLDGPRSAYVDDGGHLDQGARADLLVVPATLFAEPADADIIGTMRPLATLLDGEVVHTADEADLWS